MPKSYKEQLADFKLEKRDVESARAKPKARKPKRYKVTATWMFPMNSWTKVVLGTYSKLMDAQKACIAHSKRRDTYADVKIEEIFDEPKTVRTD